MPEPSSPDPWSALVNQLGVEPATEPESLPAAAPMEPAAAHEPRSKAAASKKPRPAANWGNIAGQLGVDVPPEPEPASTPPTEAGGPPQIESLVRGTAGRDAGRSDRPRARPRDTEEPQPGYERPARGHGDGGGRQYGRERGRGRDQQGRASQGNDQQGRERQGQEPRRGREQGRGRSRDDRGSGGGGDRASNRGSGRGRRDERGRGDRDQANARRGYRDDDRRDARDDRIRDEREDVDRYLPQGGDLESEASRYEERRPSRAAEEQASSFGMPPREAVETSLEAREVSPEFGESTDDDFTGAVASDAPDAGDEAGLSEDATATRRRRRRRGRRGVHREDKFLGIDRLATEDIVGKASHSAPQRTQEPIADDEAISLSEEITSIELGEEEDENGGTAPATESEIQRKRRRRRRRGRGSKTTGRVHGEDSTDDPDDEAENLRHDRTQRPTVRGEKQRDTANDDDDDDELDAQEETGRPNKNLHREVTPWAEAIGFIVNANMEARARSPGRWGKSDRRN